VVLIARHGKVVHFEAQGMMNIENKIPMRTDALFRLQSMTKPFASVAVMMLMEEGRFLLNDPLSKFIPEFKNPKVAIMAPTGTTAAGIKLVPADREITIHDLLTHTAGLPVADGILNRPDFVQFQKERKTDEAICDYTKRLAKVPLDFQPGAVWEYGPATDVLACLVEVVSGQRFDRFISARIFQPLGMNDTFYYVPDEKLSRLATLYEPAETAGLRARNKEIDNYPEGEGRGSRFRFGGNAGLISTAEDYLKFCQMLLNGGSFGGKQILSPKTIQTMTTNHVGDRPLHLANLEGYGFGLGFRVLTDLGSAMGLSSPGEYGWGGANGTFFWIDPKEEMIGIFMTQKTPNPRTIRVEVQTLAVQAIVK
jgi:CubicO group peptidase (beta-lactamase class C family)